MLDFFYSSNTFAISSMLGLPALLRSPGASNSQRLRKIRLKQQAWVCHGQDCPQEHLTLGVKSCPSSEVRSPIDSCIVSATVRCTHSVPECHFDVVPQEQVLPPGYLRQYPRTIHVDAAEKAFHGLRSTLEQSLSDLILVKDGDYGCFTPTTLVKLVEKWLQLCHHYVAERIIPVKQDIASGTPHAYLDVYRGSDEEASWDSDESE